MNPSALLEFRQDSAQIPGVKAQFRAEYSRCDVRPVRDLVKEPDFRQRKLGFEQPLLQEPDVPSVEPVKSSNGRNEAFAIGRRGYGVGSHIRIMGESVAFVNYLLGASVHLQGVSQFGREQ